MVSLLRNMQVYKKRGEMKKINIPIHKHTPKRYRQSIYRTDTQYNYTTGSGDWVALVTDLQRVPRGVNYITLNMDGTANKPIIHWENIIATDKELKSIEKNIAYPETKKLGFWRNLWQNKIKKLRRK